MNYNHSAYWNMAERAIDVRHMSKEIKVFGEGKVSIQPDKAEVTLGVSSEDNELKKAQSENSTSISKVIKALKELGIREDHIQTIEYSVYPIYDFVDGKQTFRTYKVNHLLRISVININQVGLVVDTAVNYGANNVSNISFSLANPVRVYQEALSRAVEDALLKASTIAQALQVRLIQTPLQVIEESSELKEPTPYGESQMVKSATTVPIKSGKQEIKATVKVVFSYSF